MNKWTMVFLAFIGVGNASIYVATSYGDIYRSDNLGIDFALISNVGTVISLICILTTIPLASF